MKNILQNYINNKHIEHRDGSCGQCLKEIIKVEVAREWLTRDDVELGKFFNEVDKRFKNTYMYKEVIEMLDSGLTIEEVTKAMLDKGFVI